MKRKELAVCPRQDVFTSAAKKFANVAVAGLKRIRVSALTAIVLPLVMISGNAANWYVRPTSQGSNTGTDWNNAWSMASLNSNWSKVQPGDTVWLAGGTYTTRMAPTANGTAANPIRVYRPRTTDSAPASASGWNAAFDSQVVIAPVDQEGIFFDTVNQGHNMIFDGRIAAGIKVVKDNGSGGSYPACVHYDGSANSTNVIYANMDLVGPFDVTSPVLSGINNYHACVSLVPKSTPLGIQYITFTNCTMHGGVNIVNILGGWGTGNAGGQHITFDHCKFYNNMASAPAYHANMFELRDVGNLTWRYCEFHTWLVEGFMPYGNPFGPIYVYGCVFHDPHNAEGVARCFEPFSNYQVFVYNNTFVNVQSVGVYSSAGNGSWASGSQARNNIYWNSKLGDLAPTQSNEFSSGNVSGANSISSGSNPFVNYAGNDFHIVSTTGAALPRNKGVSLSAPYNLDMAGNIRGADGAWDIGAYEFGSSGPATNPVIAVSPGSLDFGSIAVGTTKNLTLVVQNAGAGTLSGTASVSAPFSIVSGGTYSLGSNQSQVVTVGYSPTTASSQNQAVSFTGGGGSSATVSGSAWTILPGLSFDSFAGTITAPFVANGGYVSQANETGVANGGRAVYGFTIATAGNYNVSASVNAPSAGSDSLFVNIDAEPTEPDMIWDIAPLTTGFESRTVSWRGNGTFDSPQFPNKVFSLSAGTHQLIIRGREPNVQLGKITIAASGSVTNLPPVAPSNLRIAAVP